MSDLSLRVASELGSIQSAATAAQMWLTAAHLILPHSLPRTLYSSGSEADRALLSWSRAALGDRGSSSPLSFPLPPSLPPTTTSTAINAQYG